jgi:hypothetical protein
MAIAPCRACGKVFSSTSAFDRHRTGSYGKPIYGANRKVIRYTKHERRCKDEQEMLEAGMIQNKRGYWTTGEFDASAFAKKESEAEL